MYAAVHDASGAGIDDTSIYLVPEVRLGRDVSAADRAVLFCDPGIFCIFNGQLY